MDPEWGWIAIDTMLNFDVNIDVNTKLNVSQEWICVVYYRPQGSCGKVMFSQASVIVFTGRGVSAQCMLGYIPREAPPSKKHTPGKHTSQGSTHHPRSTHGMRQLV